MIDDFMTQMQKALSAPAEEAPNDGITPVDLTIDEPAPEPVFPLTADQSLAWQFTEEVLFSGQQPSICVQGFAGTGKSWLVGQLAKHFLNVTEHPVHQFRFFQGREYIDNYYSIVAIAAPTNKAVKVAKSMSPVKDDHERVWFGTLHSFLGLRPRINEKTGEETFERDNNIEPRKAHLLIVDECSMVNAKLKQFTDVLVRDNNIKLMWVGDPAQLPPVNEAVSPTLREGLYVVLRDVVRHGGAIQDFATKIRCAIENNTALPKVEQNFDEITQEGIIVTDREDWKQRLLADFKDERFKKDNNFVRALAWTNEAVDWGNDLVHRTLYGEGADRFVPGQVLIANKPVSVPSSTGVRDLIMSTSDECTVISATRENETTLSCRCVFWSVVVSVNGSTHTLKVIDPDYRQRFAKSLDSLKKSAISVPHGDSSYKKAWRAYFEKREDFADLRPCYWSTVHKGQGSTFERVYVANPDITRNKNIEEMRSMLYTACTRPSKQLYLV